MESDRPNTDERCTEEQKEMTAAERTAAEFEKLSRASQGNSRGWKFNREELHQRS
jgi:hypothetical protein